jgi:NAD-dependent SIR2 family protein deacetylase
MSSTKAASYLIGKKNIMIMTGAGLSAASGIPTFRGDNGFWKKKYGEIEDPT